MPSPPTEAFATPEWFEQIPVPSPGAIPGQPDFIVEHRATTPDGETVVHQQLFRGSELVAWVPQRARPHPHLTLVRPIDCDAGDLLGRLTATEIINNTTVLIGQHNATCPLGITGASRPGLEKFAPRTLDVGLVVNATPFGDAELAIRLNPDGTQHLVEPPDADPEISLQLRWPALTEYLHSDTHLGNLLNRRELKVDGPFRMLTYIGGHLSWPRTPQGQLHSQQFKAAMDTYHQLRHLDLMDTIEETTPP